VPVDMELQVAIRRLRLAAPTLTLKEIGERFGVSGMTVHRVIKGLAKPAPHQLRPKSGAAKQGSGLEAPSRSRLMGGK